MYDPATDTTSIYYGHEHPPESPLQREWEALGTTLLVVLLAPFWLAYKGCEKYHEWQDDRIYDLHVEMLKQPPVAVMVCKLGCRHPDGSYYSTEEMAKLRVVSRQPSQEDGDKKCDLMVLEPSKGEKDVQWLTCEIKAGSDSLKEEVEPPYEFPVPNFGGCTRVCCLFEGPDAWAKARPIGDLPEKPWHWYGRTHCLDHSIREERCDAESYVTCWYEYHGTRYVYQDGGSLQGFWQATPADEVYLEAVRRAR